MDQYNCLSLFSFWTVVPVHLKVRYFPKETILVWRSIMHPFDVAIIDEKKRHYWHYWHNQPHAVMLYHWSGLTCYQLIMMITMTTYYGSMSTIEDTTLERTMMTNGYELYRYRVVSDNVQSSLLNFVKSREIENQHNIFSVSDYYYFQEHLPQSISFFCDHSYLLQLKE